MIALMASGAGGAVSSDADDRAVAVSLATLLQAARSVISEKQSLIDDPDRGDKGLTGGVVLDLSRPIYRRMLGKDPLDTDADTLEGSLLRAEMDAITTVMNNNQSAINAPGVGFKGFIPAVFGRLVTEAFATRTQSKAWIKITAPIELVRNRKSLPDAWETEAIEHRFEASDWPKGADYEETTPSPSGPIFRMAVPEYYAQSCLTCHGQPKGSLDITGYPKEGAKLGDLGAVISISLRKS
jgi:hypothetical protein